jgi:aryl-alcohol dehydrogenase-like predicted oxidoreductase
MPMLTKQTWNTKHYNRLGFGSWQLGNTDFWGHMTKEDGIALVKEALERGVTFFDTAPGYAAGMSEKIIGEAIKGHRDDVFISTKFGHTADGNTDFSISSIRTQIHASLARLQTTYLDCLLLHNPGMEILTGQTDHFQELETLKKEGLIHAYGVSIDTKAELKAVLDHLRVDYVEILFNVFFQEPAKLFKHAKSQNVKLIAKVPLDSGWLTGKYDENATFAGIRKRWDKKTIERRAALVKKLKDMTEDENLIKYAIAFIMSYPEIAAVIPGIKNKEQLMGHVLNVGYELPNELKSKFIELYQNEIKDKPLPW